MRSRKKLKLSKEDIFGIAVSDFFYHKRRSRNLKKKKIRNGERGLRQSRKILSDGKNAKHRDLIVRKTRKKKKSGIKTARVFLKQKGPVHRGPRYNIPLEEVTNTYNRMRKGNFFMLVKKFYGETGMLSFWDALIFIGKVKMMIIWRWTTRSMI